MNYYPSSSLFLKKRQLLNNEAYVTVFIDLLDLLAPSGGADPGERAERGPVHIQRPGGCGPASDWPERRGGQGDLGQEDRLPPVRDRLRRRPRQRLEVPIPVLQERRRWGGVGPFSLFRRVGGTGIIKERWINACASLLRSKWEGRGWGWGVGANNYY